MTSPESRPRVEGEAEMSSGSVALNEAQERAKAEGWGTMTDEQSAEMGGLLADPPSDQDCEVLAWCIEASWQRMRYHHKVAALTAEVERLRHEQQKHRMHGAAISLCIRHTPKEGEAAIAWLKSLTLIPEDTEVRPAAMGCVTPSEYRARAEQLVDNLAAYNAALTAEVERLRGDELTAARLRLADAYDEWEASDDVCSLRDCEVCNDLNAEVTAALAALRTKRAGG